MTRPASTPAAIPVRPLEVSLYPAVKALLETQGYDVKGDILGCDVVGVRGDEPPVVVELKLAFSLALVYQGLDRLALTDVVYLAVARLPRRDADARRLCRRLGLGLIVVGDGRATVVLDPLPFRPRRNATRRNRLLREHQRRVGDPTAGGATRMPVMTAYRQEAIRCARLLEAGPMSPRALRAADDVPNAASILRRDVYGWFERVERGVYSLTPRGRAALAPPSDPAPGDAPAIMPPPAGRTPDPRR